MVRKIIANPLYTIIYLSFVLFIVVPVAYTFLTAILTDDAIINSIQLLNKGTFILLAKSCTIAFSIGFLSTLFGTTLGFIIYKTNVSFGSFFKIALLIPLFISPYILAVAWKDFFFIVFSSTNFMSSYMGLIIVLTTIFTPLSMLIIGSAMSNIDHQLEESGMMIINSTRVVTKIILPLIKPAVISSFVLVFIFSISEFSVPAYFGVSVITTEIFTQFSAYYNHSLAILQSLLLIIICVFLLFSERKYISNTPFLSIGNGGMKTKLFTLNNRKGFSLIVLFVWLFISIIIPLLILVIQSFKNGPSKFIRAYELLLPTFSNSIWLALLSALIIVFVGYTASYNFNGKEGKIGKLFYWMLLIIFAIPSIILGISLIKFYNQPSLNFIYSSYTIIIIGYVGKFSFISAKLIGNAIKQIPKSLDETAQIIGISGFNRIRKIQLPLILPSLFVAFIVSFIFCFGELGLTIMLYPPGSEIMPIKVFTIMANAPQSLTSAMTLIVFTITLLIISGFYLIVKSGIKNFRYSDD